MKLLLGTGNRDKVREISAILAGSDVELVSLTDFPEIPEVVEDGETLEANARKKALLPARASGLWTLADDTGLEVDALDGAPGVYSARYAGEDCSYSDNVEKLLRELKGVKPPRRTAVFRCVMALASPEGEVRLREGRLPGVISESPAGSNGFGYDPVFLLPERGKTFAELSTEEKNRISHRGLALRAMAEVLKGLR